MNIIYRDENNKLSVSQPGRFKGDPSLVEAFQIGSKIMKRSDPHFQNLCEALGIPKDGIEINNAAVSSVTKPTTDTEPIDKEPAADDVLDDVPEGDLSNTEVVNQNFKLKLGFLESTNSKNLVAYKDITILNWEEIPGIISRLKDAAKEQFNLEKVDVVVLEAHMPTMSATSTSDDKIVDFLTLMLDFLIKSPEEEETTDINNPLAPPAEVPIAEELELPRDFYSLAIEFGFTPVISERADATKMQRDNLFLYLIYSDPFDIIYKSYEIRENGMGIHSGNSYTELEQFLTKLNNDSTDLV